jgi:S-formylglutathione hydrolase FrmB
MRRIAIGIGLVACLIGGWLAADEPGGGLRFEVTVAAGLLEKPTDGRLLVVLSRGEGSEPRFSIGSTGMSTAPVLGADVNQFAPGVVGVVNSQAEIFPVDSVTKLPAGNYRVQAVFDWNPDLRLTNAPGNLYSKPVNLSLDPSQGGLFKLQLTERVPDERLPADSDSIKYLKLPSKLLSEFHGRPMFLRAGVALPPEFASEPGRKFPLRVHIGGYGTRYTAIRQFGRRGSGPVPMVILQLDGAGPYGDPYQVNSANNGPYGDAVIRELIPHVEKTFRCYGDPRARFTDGGSTGGWVSLALQIFYPDFFNGCWSFAPDPVDFRAYELINIYSDENAYVNRFGFERPAMRTAQGDTIYTVRHEAQLENVLGRGNAWWRSGKDWCAWNAVFGPRGADGHPKPLWHPKTGAIDRSVVETWKHKDLRHVLESNWKSLAPKLAGKIHIYVGDADDFFLNNAVRLLDAATKKFDPPFDGVIQFGPMAGHGYHGTPRVDEAREMAERFSRVMSGE